ncbi:MAG: Peptidoglycan-N-acetylmuramic acid deacetylase PdaA precursor [Firmicutes bacterium ADurb.Bin456]|nr:MAG: Peptidoglycan-N-acetylmuramic acid deacetylase PdaA precursor [Firmicutes bacterium ADurb.Bin456]
MKVYFFNISKIIKFILTVSLLGGAALFMTAVLLEPAGKPDSAGTKVICRIKTAEKTAALTFNVGWGNRVPGPVLDILKDENVKATFFISGSWARNHPELARRIAREGHEIGNSGEGLSGPWAKGGTALKDLLAKSRDDIREVTGITPTLFRVTGGTWDTGCQAAAKEPDWVIIQWSLDSLDIQTPGPDKIVENVIKGVQPGSIILLNASDTASQTPEALPAVIRALRGEGYQLVTVSFLLKQGPGLSG